MPAWFRSPMGTVWSHSIHIISRFLQMPRRVGHLLQATGESLAYHGKALTIAQNGARRFWGESGYLSTEWNSPPPSGDLRFKCQGAVETLTTIPL